MQRTRYARSGPITFAALPPSETGGPGSQREYDPAEPRFTQANTSQLFAAEMEGAMCFVKKGVTPARETRPTRSRVRAVAPSIGLLLTCALAASCMTAVKTYDGDALPKEKVAIVTVLSKVSDLQVTEVDGKALSLKVNGWVDQRDCDISLLPGRHTLKVSLRGIATAPGSPSDVVLSVDVEAGSAYELKRDVESASVDSLRTNVRVTPYVVNRTTGQRVSTLQASASH